MEKMVNSGMMGKIYKYGKENAIPLKILIYCFHGGAVCIFPFVTLHMQLLGVSVKEIAVVSLITPITALLGPVLNGLVADKLGRYGLVLVINIILMILSYDLLLTVPRVPHRTATVSCDASNILIPDCGTCFRNASNNSLQLTRPWNYDGGNMAENFQENINLAIFRGKDTPSECRFNISKSASNLLNAFINCTSDSGFEANVLDSANCKDELVIAYSAPFYIFFLLRAISSFVVAAGFSMLEASVLSEAKILGLSIGKQRVMVMIGYATTPLLAAALTDYYSDYIGYQSHVPSFVVGSVFLAFAALIMAVLNVRVERSKEDVIKNFLHLFQRIEVLLFLMMLLLLGTNFGFIEAYLFLFMNSLGSPTIALALTITVGCTASIPVLYFSDWIHTKLSREVIYLICFTAYSLRLVGYSVISNPWWALLFESLEAINYQLMWVTSLKFFPILAPKRMLATMTGLSMATHYAFGQGLGGFLGGYFIEWYGYQVTFQIMAVISLFGGVFSFYTHRFIIRNKITV